MIRSQGKNTQEEAQFGYAVVSNSLWPDGLQHSRPPCPSATPGACSNWRSSSRWCHPTISSSVVPFSSCLQSFPASGSFQMSQFFASGGQSTGVSASASVLPMNIPELPHIRGQGLWPRGAPPPPRSGCWETGGLRGATPRSRSGGAAVRR